MVTRATDAGLFCWCRPGFEPDLAAELTHIARLQHSSAWARTERGSGQVDFLGEAASSVKLALQGQPPIFARQVLGRIASLDGLDPADRITPVLAALEGDPLAPFGEVWVEYPDSDDGRPLAALARSFGNALRPALRNAGLLTNTETLKHTRLHVCLRSGTSLVLAHSLPGLSTPWPLGIPRLRMSSDAPSRSAMKLEEALLTLLSAEEREHLLRPGMRAADLGAAPGGWTWVLTRHGLQVTAIDNGPLRPHLLETGLVTHLREDGFRWQPPQPLHWMVCDMVEQPIRVAARMAEWFANGWCARAVFNLKLPMKQRWAETGRCLRAFTGHAGVPVEVRARQLYHDREEITVCALRLD